MPTVKVISNITFEELINGVLQLSAKDYDKFINKIQELKQQKDNAKVSPKEQQLILQIKEQLSPSQLKRLQFLEKKQKNKTLTKSENQEMADFIQQIERLHAQRILAIGMLAQLRGTSVEDLSKEFGFKPIING